jgi:hypothetical protein
MIDARVSLDADSSKLTQSSDGWTLDGSDVPGSRTYRD